MNNLIENEKKLRKKSIRKQCEKFKNKKKELKLGEITRKNIISSSELSIL